MDEQIGTRTLETVTIELTREDAAALDRLLSFYVDEYPRGTLAQIGRKVREKLAK